MTSVCDMVIQIMQKKEEDKRIAEDQAAKDQYWKIPICYNDDDDEMKHLDTISETESDELIKSSVEDLVHTPSESDGISEGKCDLPVYDDFTLKKDEVLDDIISIPPGNGNDHFNAEYSLIESVLNRDNEISSPKIDFLTRRIFFVRKLLNVNLLIANIEALKDNPTPSSDFVTKSFSTSLNLFLEETNTFDNSLPLSETFCFNLEEISSGSTTTRSDLSLLDYEAFYLDDDHIEEKSSGSTTTHADFSQYD
ncbi:hypothetical protein Tco_1335430 [Tanacetum coccineum]